jgi:hypothetical protein
MASPSNPVVAQAQDDSLANRDPVLVRAAIVGIINAVLAFLVVNGTMTEAESAQFVVNLKILAPSVALLAPLIAGWWGKLAAYSPRSAAEIAVENVNAGYVAGKEGAPLPEPTLALAA